MSQTFKDGLRLPVTKIVVGPCTVSQVKSKDKDGYWAVQLAFGKKKVKSLSNPIKGHLKSILKDLPAQAGGSQIGPRFLREVRLSEESELKVGDVVKLDDVLKEGDVVTVTSTSKGKGFAGVVKRHHFAGGPKTHGQSDRQRAPGSIGQGTTPGRVYKGKKMAGKMGNDTVTLKNIVVVSVNSEKNEIAVKGPVPGTRDSLVIIKKTQTK